MSIELQDVTKRFAQDLAVDRLSGRVEDGEFFVVLGPSGCGKSTLLRLIAGLEQLDNGTISLSGRTVAGPGQHLAPEARGVGVVFQSYALWPHMSVLRNIAFPLEARGSRRASAEDGARKHLDTVDLAPYEHRKPAELSGGQRQRVALARCLASDARTVLMDEPLANLDPHLRGTMEQELRRFHGQAGATTLYITHDQREAMAMADRIAVMNKGRFEQIAPPDDLYARPANAFVAGFIGAGAIIDARVTDSGLLRFGPWSIPLAIHDRVARPGPVRLLLRPEWLSVDAARGEMAQVETVTYRGGSWECLMAADGLTAPLILNVSTRIRPGETLPVAVNRSWILPATNTD
ncbi:MAG: ABC transporter ATP-binding protein [Minwuia sp.]|nr:ABC transporter ATP-binding protein [Minwuia sp.]